MTVNTQTSNLAAGIYSNLTQKSTNIATNPTGLNLTITIDANGDVEVNNDGTLNIVINDGGTAYVNDKTVTFSGADLGGSDGTDDLILNITSLSFANPASTETLLNASIDSVTVTNSGSGYLSAPNITAQGGNGINSNLNAIIQNEGVVLINVVNAGQQ